MNWLDFILIAILAVTIIIGIFKGFLQQLFSILTVILGLILAHNFYSRVSWLYHRFISYQLLAHFLGFLTIFLAVLGLGLSASFFLYKLAKGPVKLLNNVLGGVFGLLTGILICGVVVFAFSVFPVDKKALKKSRLSSPSLRMTKAIISLIPRELREKFRETYQEVTERVGKNGKKI